jgi:DtxR family Mn-dependent transcriptional regulator
MHTQAIEDYLKTIYGIQVEQGQVATTVLAERLGVAPPSATNMVKKLAELGLVVHQPYYGLQLTEAGQKMALKVLRCHRLVERFLAERLSLPWDQVHAEAEKWEHVLSEEMQERMDALLGYPTTDPHGAPIPASDGTMARLACIRLSDLKPGQAAVITKVSDHNPVLLRYLGSLGLYPGVQISLAATAPPDDVVIVQVGAIKHALGRAAVNHIFVTNRGE